MNVNAMFMNNCVGELYSSIFVVLGWALVCSKGVKNGDHYGHEKGRHYKTISLYKIHSRPGKYWTEINQ